MPSGQDSQTGAITAEGLDARVDIANVGSASGRYLANPVTGERHEARIVLPEGFIWKDGNCGVGSFAVSAEGLDLSFKRQQLDPLRLRLVQLSISDPGPCQVFQQPSREPRRSR